MVKKVNLLVLLMMIAVVFSFNGVALANVGNSNNISDILGKELAPDGTKIDDTKIQDNIADIVGKVRMVAIGVTFIMMVITGIMFSTSGKNEQRRTGAFLSMIGIAAGVFCIMQAATLVGWFSNLGQ
ncbi:hypothetical protein P9G84_31165 [Brevibacillus centrosporus]|uniref:hypothetical protein n=1 Tax=Brevibacillus centrosporus TaxID=54910 RepID=UPI001141EB9D|nr:hypothetical protein [Brevibacillus centrosporus]MEC2133318.1 hypothetical protein [Brevibacillus centrosporus]GED33926.1 hypothetical protein BCE02nite_50670 [Brevibacillus centrosporus]